MPYLTIRIRDFIPSKLNHKSNLISIIPPIISKETTPGPTNFNGASLPLRKTAFFSAANIILSFLAMSTAFRLTVSPKEFLRIIL